MPFPEWRVVFSHTFQPDECDATFELEGREDEANNLVAVTLRVNGRYLTTHRASNWDRMFGRENQHDPA